MATDNSTPPPPNPRPPGYVRRRPSYEPIGLVGKNGGVLLYSALALGAAGAALYMAFVEHRPLNSPWVIGPAVGAVWFGLRIVMMQTPKA